MPMYCKGYMDSMIYPERSGDPTPDEPEIVCLLLLCGMHTQHPGIGDPLYHVRDNFNYILGCKITQPKFSDPIAECVVNRLIENELYDALVYLISHGFRVGVLYRHTLTDLTASRLLAYTEQHMPHLLKDRSDFRQS